ncbi:DUF881 domain-containing protein [uncultured Clostridium sp.]|jgi:uncharacterized protein YlxW (UPF0749 family)|uniref:DUF881 domain-containing protein n=1 Tax=uncultured Clostridium sp. TaxID=59620 RepID=UPI002611659C|nr:DUF881 domain-containing protein [uncultured Clostridium sp.]
MNNREINFFLFIAAIILGILFSINLGISGEREKQISIQEYQDAYEKRTSLLSDINRLKKESDELSKKFKEYNNFDTETSEIDMLEEELLNNENLLGVTKIEGEGVILKLEDGVGTKVDEQDSFLVQQRTIHDNDMSELLNDIKIAGAEAIAINGKRIINNTSVVCGGQFLKVNYVRVPAPFYVKIIGDKDMLNASLLSEEGTLKRLMNRGIQAEITVLDKIEMPPYIGKLNYSKN